MEFDNNKPVYIQIMDMIIQDIITNKYKPGEKILSIRELSLTYLVNQNTVLHSYKELERLGIIYMKRGIGYFVNEDQTFLNNLRDQKLNELITEFISNMKNIGYSYEEIIEHIKEFRDDRN